MLAKDALRQARIMCSEVHEWVGRRTVEEAWRDCQRGDWMLRWAGLHSGPPWGEGRKRLVPAACACARLAQDRDAPPDSAGLSAILTAEAWARGEATRRQVEDAFYAAYAYAAAYAADYADYAAYAAAAAAYDAAAAYAAAYAAAAAAYDAYDGVLWQCADLLRLFYPDPPGGGTRGG